MASSGRTTPSPLPVTPESGGEQGQSALSNKTYGADLGELIRREIDQAHPENTRAAYQRALVMFGSWCTGQAEDPAAPDPLVLAGYVLWMRDSGYSPATISQHLGAIQASHKRDNAGGTLDMYPAALLLRKYRRDLAEAGKGQRQATPITPEALRAMVATLDVTTVKGQRDRLALVLGFCGMLRRSELVGLRVHDVSVTDDGVTLLVRTSKTDKDSRGRHVPIPPQRDPDPVSLTAEWLRLVDDGPLLRRVTRADELTDSPWRAAGVCDMVKRCARDAHLPNPAGYSAHSLRAGGLTASLRAGVPLGVAARHGGWNPESAVPARYARVADQWRDNAMRGVL